jgi:N-acetylglucosamine repressor
VPYVEAYRRVHCIEGGNMSFSDDTLRVLMVIGRQGPMSRSRISRELGFPPSRVTRLAEALVSAGLLEETGFEASTGGRRGTLLTFRQDTYIMCGIRISIAAVVDVVLMDLHANTLEQRSFTLSPDTTPGQVVAAVRQALEDCFTAHSGLRERLIGVGLGTSGLVSPERGCVLRSRAFPEWRDVPIVDLLAAALDVPVFLENEVAMSTAAEQWFGNGRGCRNFLYISLGQGVRMGLVIEGRLYRGMTGNAGELGHTTYRKDGPVCYCGNVGCLERYVSTDALLYWGRDALGSHSDSRLGQLCPRPENLNLDHIFQAAREGDRMANTLLRRVARPIGQTLAGLINIFDTEKILVAGGLAGAGDLLLSLLREQIDIHALPHLGANTQLQFAELKQHGTAIGGGALILEKLCSGRIVLPK